MKTKEKPSKPSVSAPAPPKADEFKMIRRADLFPDPDQLRKTFGEQSLQQLAASIQEQGIVQPLIVRFVPAKYKIQEPDLHCKDYVLMERNGAGEWVERDRADEKNAKVLGDGWPVHFGKVSDGPRALTDHYVIIAGERRWRAAAIAGLDELPCVVRDVDARRKFAQQWIENNQREGVSAIEEAEALDREFKRRRQSEPELVAEAFAKENGMSRADFYGTLVLTRLHKPVRDALVTGKISPSLAKVVALVPEPKQQEKLLAVLTDEESWQYPFSVRDAQDLVDEEYVKNLNEAPFKKASGFPWSKEFPESVKATVAGIPNAFVVSTCEECPHRSGNMVEEFPELAKRPNVCTNVHCFALKCKAHWIRAAADAKEDGDTVMSETEFRKVKAGYIAGDKHEYAQNRSGTMETLMGKHAPEPVLVATKDGLKKFFKKDEAETAFKKNGVKFYHRKTPADYEKEREKEAIVTKLRDKRQAFAESLIAQAAKGIQALKDGEAWTLALAHVGHGHHRIENALGKLLKGDRALVIGRLLSQDLGGVTDWQHGNWDKDALKLWKLLGVDLEAEEKKAEAVAQKSLALPSKKDPEQGTLLTVKKNKKKGGKR